MHITEIPQLEALSTSEKIILVEELWDSIRTAENSIAVTDSQKKVLDSRLKKHGESPGTAIPFEQFKNEIEKRKQ